MSILDSGVVRVEREIAADPEEVFAAWVDPDVMQLWMAPDPMTVGDVTCDPRVGGAYRIVMVDPSGAVEHRGHYEVIDPPYRLVFTWQADHLADAVTRVSVSLSPTEAGTRMVLEHDLLPESERAPHSNGWTSIADKLAATLTTPPK